MGKWFNWPPFKIYAIDADTGKPLDPNVRRKTYVKYYEVGKNSKGQQVLVAPKQEPAHANGKDGDKKDKSGAGKDGDKKDKPDASKQDGDKKKDGQAAADNANNGAGSGKTWRAEEDEKLKAMKADNKSWADIVKELKCSKKDCQSRWKELNSTDDAKAAADAKKDDGKAPHNQQKAGNATTPTPKNDANAGKRKQKQSNQNNVNDKNDKKKQADKDKQAEAEKEATLRLNGVLTWREDDVFNSNELQTLAKLYQKDSTQSWLRLASVFYDKTGRRVHPDDIRDKFEELGLED